MQQLVDAVRSTGASQPIMLGGLGYSSDESQWLAHEPHDPDGQLVVSFHTYNFSGCNDEACWNEQIAPLARRFRSSPARWARTRARTATSTTTCRGPTPTASPISAGPGTRPRRPSYWSCSEGPALIKTYAGKPTPFGAGLKRHLAKLASSRPKVATAGGPVTRMLVSGTAR